MRGAYLTLNITFFSFVLALGIGVVVGIARFKSKALKGLLAPYVELFRGTPLLIQLFFIYYAMPVTGFSMNNMTAAYAGVGLCGGAYISEIIRASLGSIPKVQEEAALALGLNWLQTMRHVILPQAFRVAIPPLMNSLSTMLKDTSLVSVLAINELTRTGQMVYSRTFRPFEIYTAVALMYFIMTYSLTLVSYWLEKNCTKGQVQNRVRQAKPGRRESVRHRNSILGPSG
jgi:polar amino acid transport system permease protein